MKLKMCEERRKAGKKKKGKRYERRMEKRRLYPISRFLRFGVRLPLVLYLYSRCGQEEGGKEKEAQERERAEEVGAPV